MTSVFVDFTDSARPHELFRDARDPQGDDQSEIERLADVYSRGGRLIRVYPVDQWVTPWHKRQDDPLYESRDGQATPDFRTVGS